MGAGLKALHPSVCLLRPQHDSVPQEALTPSRYTIHVTERELPLHATNVT